MPSKDEFIDYTWLIKPITPYTNSAILGLGLDADTHYCEDRTVKTAAGKNSKEPIWEMDSWQQIIGLLNDKEVAFKIYFRSLVSNNVRPINFTLDKNATYFNKTELENLYQKFKGRREKNNSGASPEELSRLKNEHPF